MDQEEMSSAEKQAFMATALIMSAVDDNEPFGTLGSELYAVAEGIGCPLECFTSVLSTLVAQGVLERHGSCYCRSMRLSASVEISLAE